MEEDRYRKNNKLYSLGLISLLLCLSLLAFSLFLLPNLLFGWRYDTPEFVMHFREWLLLYNFTEVGAARFTLFLFFLLTVIFGVIAYIASNRVDNEIYEEDLKENVAPEPIAQQPGMSESMGFGLKIFFIIIVVFIVAILFELVLRSTSPPPPVDESSQYVN